MKQETFKKLVALSAVGMTAYTVHCLLQLIRAGIDEPLIAFRDRLGRCLFWSVVRGADDGGYHDHCGHAQAKQTGSGYA